MAGYLMSLILLKRHIQLTIWQAIKQSMLHGGVIPTIQKHQHPRNEP